MTLSDGTQGPVESAPGGEVFDVPAAAWVGGLWSLTSTLRLWASLLALVVVAAWLFVLLPNVVQFRQAGREIDDVRSFQRFVQAADALASERSPSNMVMGSAPADASASQVSLAATRRHTDAALAALSAANADVASLSRLQAGLVRARQTVDRVAALPVAQRSKPMLNEAVADLLALADLMRPLLSDRVRQLGGSDPVLGSALQVAAAVSDLREFCGRLGSLVVPSIITHERMEVFELANFNAVHGRILQIDRTLDSESDFEPATPLGQQLVRARALYFGKGWPMVADLAAQGSAGVAYGLDVAGLSHFYVPMLHPIEDLNAQYLQVMMQRAIQRRTATRRTLLTAIFAACLLGGAIFALFQYLRRRVLQPLVLASRATVALAGRDSQVALPPIVSHIAEIRALHAALGVLAKWIGERNQLVERLRFQARTDQLTGLPNRSRFAQVATSALHIAQPGRFGLLYIDLDEFKQINDALGHHIGDDLLVQVAQRLVETISDRAFVARIGGDEFAACCVDLDVEGQVALANDILRALSTPYSLAGAHRLIGASVGIAPLSADRADYAELCQQADIALYEAKAAGRNTYRVFSNQTLRDFVERSELKSQLGEALAARQFRLVFQPIFDVRSGAAVRCEALMRWQHPRRGLVSPSVFVPLLEGSGLIDEAGRWLLAEATRIAATWPEAVGVSVNVSPLQLLRPTLVEDVTAALAASGLTPSRLQIEITESSLIAPTETTSRVLDGLRTVGVGIAIDDFGTGYSSFSYLRDRRFDTLKIDRCFIEEIGSRLDTETILRSVIELARSLGMRVVAEGVETSAQLSWLRAHRCDYVQGYLLAEPVSAQQLPARFRMPA